MEGKAKFIFPAVITAMIVFVVSGLVTAFNIGFRPDFDLGTAAGFSGAAITPNEAVKLIAVSLALE